MPGGIRGAGDRNTNITTSLFMGNVHSTEGGKCENTVTKEPRIRYYQVARRALVMNKRG